MVAMVPQTDLLLIAIPCIVVIAILIFLYRQYKD